MGGVCWVLSSVGSLLSFCSIVTYLNKIYCVIICQMTRFLPHNFNRGPSGTIYLNCSKWCLPQSALSGLFRLIHWALFIWRMKILYSKNCTVHVVIVILQMRKPRRSKGSTRDSLHTFSRWVTINCAYS